MIRPPAWHDGRQVFA